MAQRDVSDAESISSDAIREPRRRNCPSDPTSREIEDHVLTGHATFRSWCAACVESEVEPRDTGEKASRNLRIGQRSQSCRDLTASLGAGIEFDEAEVEQRGDSPVLTMHDGVTKHLLI